MTYWWLLLGVLAIGIGQAAWADGPARVIERDPFDSNAAVVRDAETGQPLSRLRADPFHSDSWRLEDYDTGGNGQRVEPDPFGDGYRTEPED